MGDPAAVAPPGFEAPETLVIVIGHALFGTLSIVCGLVPDENWLITARVVHGAGAALAFVGAIALLLFGRGGAEARAPTPSQTP